jgi:hypothetical protein
MADKVTFQTNITQEIALAFAEPKEVQSTFSPDGRQFMFSLTDGRVMFLNTSVAERVKSLNLQPKEPFEMCRQEKVEGNRKRVEWHIAKVGVAEEAPAVQASAPASGNHQVAQAQPPTNGTTPAPVNGNGANANGHANGNGHHPTPDSPYEHSGPSLFLTEQTNMLIDVYARCMGYASQKYEGRVKPDDVRSILLSAYIGMQKGGTR